MKLFVGKAGHVMADLGAGELGISGSLLEKIEGEPKLSRMTNIIP